MPSQRYDVALSTDGSTVRLSQENGPAVMFPRAGLPSIIDALARHLIPGEGASLPRSAMAAQAAATLFGFEVLHQPGGGAILRLTLALDQDGMVAHLPVPLAPSEVESLRKLLQR